MEDMPKPVVILAPLVNSPSKYHDKYKCVECEGVNDIEVSDSIDYTICECNTTCTECGFKSYWAYGFFNTEYQ